MVYFFSILVITKKTLTIPEICEDNTKGAVCQISKNSTLKLTNISILTTQVIAITVAMVKMKSA